MKQILFIITFTISFNAVCQKNEFVFTGKVHEKIKMTDRGYQMSILESYDPPIDCKIVLRPGLIYFTFNGETRMFYGTGPGEKDSEGSVYFPATSDRGSSDPDVMLIRNYEGEIIFLYIINKDKTAVGYQLK
jgi:hypothetical protein